MLGHAATKGSDQRLSKFAQLLWSIADRDLKNMEDSMLLDSKASLAKWATLPF